MASADNPFRSVPAHLDLALAALIFLWALTLGCFGLDGNDTWWHLAVGRHILDIGHFPTVDPFSHLHFQQPWIAEHWLFDLAAVALWKLGGEGALVLAKAVAVAALFTALGFAQRRCGVPWAVTALVCVPVLLALAPRLRARPEIVDWIALSLFALLLPRGGESPSRRALIVLPLVQIVWTNCHSAFLLGPAFAGLTALGQGLNALFNPRFVGTAHRFSPLRRHIDLMALLIFATLLNPYGWNLHSIPLATLLPATAVPEINEWLPPWTVSNPLIRFAIPLLLAVSVPPLIATRRRWDAVPLLWLAVFTMLALTAARHASVFAVAGFFVATEAWSETLAIRAGTSRRLALAAAAVLLALTALTMTSWLWALHGSPRRFGLTAAPWRYPVAEADFLAATQPPGNGFHSYADGGYLMWRLFPEKRVLIDSRFLVYEPEELATANAVLHGQLAWEPYFRAKGIRWALVPHARESLMRSLARASGWKPVQLGASGMIFVEQSEANRGVAPLTGADLETFAMIAPPENGALTPRQSPVVAQRQVMTLMNLGRPDLALQIAEAMLARDSDDEFFLERRDLCQRQLQALAEVR